MPDVKLLHIKMPLRAWIGFRDLIAPFLGWATDVAGRNGLFLVNAEASIGAVLGRGIHGQTGLSFLQPVAGI